MVDWKPSFHWIQYVTLGSQYKHLNNCKSHDDDISQCLGSKSEQLDVGGHKRGQALLLYEIFFFLSLEESFKKPISSSPLEKKVIYGRHQHNPSPERSRTKGSSARWSGAPTSIAYATRCLAPKRLRRRQRIPAAPDATRRPRGPARSKNIIHALWLACVQNLLSSPDSRHISLLH